MIAPGVIHLIESCILKTQKDLHAILETGNVDITNRLAETIGDDTGLFFIQIKFRQQKTSRDCPLHHARTEVLRAA